MWLSKNRMEKRERIIAFKKIFGMPEGKTVLYHLMNTYHVLNSHKGDAFFEGQRSVVLEIMHQCGISIEELDRLVKGEEEV